MDSQFTYDRQDRVFTSFWAASLLVLLGLTWKLWLPGFSEFPRVPVPGVSFATILFPIHYLASVALVAGLVGTIVDQGNFRRWLGLTAVAWAILFFCNQHCLQPWAWQAFIIAVLLCLLPVHESKKWVRWVLISIYVFSAAGKFDYQFTHTVGESFVITMLQWVGLGSYFGEGTVRWLVTFLPIGEACVAIGLTVQKTRRMAAWLAIVFHVVLFALLSPMGLGHQPPVLLWNGISILLVVWMFLLDSGADERGAANRPESTALNRFAKIFALIVLCGPLLRPAGLWDHWLAWGLYSPSNSRVETHVAESALPRVDSNLKPFLQEEVPWGIRRFAMGNWSLEELGVPIYPQARFQKAVALEVLRQQDLTSFAQVFEYSQAHATTGKRSRTEVELSTN